MKTKVAWIDKMFGITIVLIGIAMATSDVLDWR